jgi:hypothetical protein
LLSAEIGEGLFFAGNNHVALKVVASPDEHQILTGKQSSGSIVEKQEATKTKLIAETE